MSMTQDLGLDLARYSIETRYEDLPQDAVDAAKKSILDLLGVTLAAREIEPVAGKILDYIQVAGGTPECTVPGLEERLPAAAAAFANGALTHCLDFDDLTPWGAHATSSILPAALAIAERKGGVSGRELITAVAIAQDMFARMRRNVDWTKDWNISTVFGVFAATAAAGRLLGCQRSRTARCLESRYDAIGRNDGCRLRSRRGSALHLCGVFSQGGGGFCHAGRKGGRRHHQRI